MLTLADLTQALPNHLKVLATQDMVDRVTSLTNDPEVAENYRNNVVSYTAVLKEGRFKVEDYLNAVAYVSFKIMGYSNQDSYKRTFPQRYTNLIANGADEKTVSSYVSAYNKNKLVNLIVEQTLVPVWVLNQDIYQKAINTQAMLMLNSKSDKVRCDAANSLLTHLKRPEKAQVELSFGESESAGMKDLKDTLAVLAKQQQALIGQGVNTREIAHQRLGELSGEIIDAEVISVGVGSKEES